MLLAVVEDLLRRDGSDTGQRVQLLQSRRVQMNRTADRRSTLSFGRGHPRLDDDAARHDDLRPVRDLSREVDEAQVGPTSGSSRPADSVRDPGPMRQPVEAWTPNRADDVHDQARRCRRLDLAGRRRRSFDRRRPAADEEPSRDEQPGDEQRRCDERARTRDLEALHAAHGADTDVPCLSPTCTRGVTNPARTAYMRCMKQVTSPLADIARRHLDDVYRYVLYLTRDPQAAEDLAAETFERAVRLWHRFDPARGSERTWLCQIARTAALDHLRAEERRRRREDRYANLADRSEEIDDQTLSPWLQSALAALSAADREVIALRVILDLDPASAGRVLGITPTACTTRLNRALEKLERNARTARVA